MALVDVLLKQLRRLFGMHPAPDQSPLVNIYSELLLRSQQRAVTAPAGRCLPTAPSRRCVPLPAASEECSLVTGASKPAPQLCALPFLFFLLPLKLPLGYHLLRYITLLLCL